MASTIIASFHRADDGHWVAELACGHHQPMDGRPWVDSDAERAQQVGAPIECPLCTMPALPAGLHEYRRTATFSESEVPAGLLRDHATKAGVWALVVVETGTLEYTIEKPLQSFLLSPEVPGVIPPVVPHRVKLLGPVRFHVEFFRTPDQG